ncbi:MAG: hypothetical protein ACAF42_13025 [Limnothrix sp. BL-A-16]
MHCVAHFGALYATALFPLMGRAVGGDRPDNAQPVWLNPHKWLRVPTI